MAIEKYKTLLDFPNQTAAVQIIYSVSSAFPNFFPLFLFLFWIFFTASGYFIVLKTSGQRRYWQYSTAISFITFILTLPLVALNGEVTVLNPYWIAFYILVTIGSYLGLKQYK